jgi:hypothetical protein
MNPSSTQLHRLTVCCGSVILLAGAALALTQSHPRPHIAARPAHGRQAAAQRTAAEQTARRFTVGYLRYLHGSPRIPADVTRTLQARLLADPPVVSPGERQTPLRLQALSVSSRERQARVLVSGGEGIRWLLLLNLTDAHGRLLVSQVQAGQ